MRQAGTPAIVIRCCGGPDQALQTSRSCQLQRPAIQEPVGEVVAIVLIGREVEHTNVADGQEIVPILTDGDAYERQVEAFARAIRDDLAPTPDVSDGLAALKLIEATARSVATGTEVGL